MKKNAFVLPVMMMLVIAPCCGEGGSSLTGSEPGIVEELRFTEGVDVASSFCESFYRPVESTVEPNMPILGLPVEDSEIFNLRDVIRLAGLLDIPDGLLENGFAVFSPANPTDNPVTAYERIDGWDQPIYVSAGIPLHLLHIFFDQILQSLEEEHLYRDLVSLCTSLYEANLARECDLGAAFFAVPLAFLEPGFEPDASIAAMVREEVELIEAHGGFSDSPVFGYGEDYSQYVPRGHYTASPRLERYFRAMMWLGRLTMLLNGGEPNGPRETYIVSEEDAAAMTACALQIVSDLGQIESEGELLLAKWQRIYEITAFFAGFADDLSVPEYAAATLEFTGGSAQSDLVWSTGFYRDFRSLVNTEFAGPAIYSGTGELVSMPDEQGGFDPADLQEAFSKTTGFRFLGQRYAPDSEILGKLVFPAVGRDPSGQQRFMPTGLDVAAVFGSAAALSILEERGDFDFAHYADSVASLAEMVDSYTETDWHSTLYMSWLHCLYLLQAERGEGYPDFMRTPAWDRHTLSNFLASWAMLRHDTILYVKQSYTMTAGCAPGPFDEPVPSAGFIEPVPEVYAELRATLEMARRGLDAYGVLDGDVDSRFNNAISLLQTMQDIAERELAGETITPEDADFLKGFAGYLEGAIAWGGDTTEGLETSLVADVHTDQNSSSVLEVASGDLDYCMVVYRRPDGHVETAIGPVLSYYEFTWPMSDRLTDEAWREMLDAGTVERPTWTEAFLTD